MKKKVTLRKWLLTCLVLISSIGLANAQLSGTYTIDPNGSGSSNYTSFGDAVTALTNNGVSGPVTFQVAADSFNEMITITKIVGASASNRITFEGAGMYNTVLWYQTNATTVYLTDTAGYITFKDMTIDDPDQVGTAVHIDKGSHDIIVEDCYLTTAMGTSGNILVYFQSGAHDNLFQNNVMEGGYYSVYANYSSNATGNSFIGNDISGYYYYGFYYWYQEDFVLKNNNLHSPGYQYAYGFYPYYAQNFEISDNVVNGMYYSLMAYYTNNFEILRNRFLNSGVYGMYFYQGNNSGSDTSYVVNNMVTTSAQGYLFYAYMLNRTHIYHNSFYGPTYYGLMMQNGGNNEFINNSIQSEAQYYGLYVTGTPFTKMDYNNLNINAAQDYAYWSNTFYNSLSDLQSNVSGYNQNSISVDPEYVSSTDLHADGLGLNNKGIELAAVPYDIDGDPRPLSPDTLVDIGADEFYVAPNDLDVESIESPKSLVLSGNNTVTAVFRNKGMNGLSNLDVKVAYSYDGGSNWTEDTLNISSLAAGDRDTFTFTVPFSISSAGTYNICVRITDQISGDPDTEDEICTDVCDGRSGTIIVDATGNGDHTTINGALDELDCGIVGPVTILVKPGTYNERLVINEIFGASSTNTITIEGVSRDSVFLVQAGGQSAILLNNVSYVTIKELDIQTSAGATGVKITGTSTYNQILNNKIDMPSSTSTNAFGVLIGTSYNAGGPDNNHNLIEDNVITGGYGGVAVSGASGSGAMANRIVGNHIDGAYQYGISAWYNRDLEIRGNVIENTTNQISYGLYTYYNNNSVYSQNIVRSIGYMAWSGYYENYTNSQSTDTTWVENNMFGGGMVYQYAYTIYSLYAHKIKFRHNSVHADNGQNYGILMQLGNNWDMRNNNFSLNNGGTYGMYFNSMSFTHLDYNNYYNTSNNMVRWQTSDYSSLQDWQQGQSQYNQNSTEGSPEFISATDLHLNFTQPFHSGTPLGVMEDVDGDTRCATAPTVGADESRYPVPPPVADFLAPDTAWLDASSKFYNSAGAGENYSYSWFVDGNFVTSSLHMNNTFTSTGTYDVKLVTEGCSGVDSVTKTIVVSLPTRAPEADFLADITEGVIFETIQLTDLSENGASSWEWIITPDTVFDADFGITVPTFFFISGNENSQNPQIAFEYPGKYDICLVASNNVGSDTICKSEYITIFSTVNMCFFPFETDITDGILYDDGGPMGDYSAGKNGINQCYYVINSCEGDVEMNFEEFSLNTGDYLRVYDGADNTGTPLWDAVNFPKGMNGNLSDPSVKTLVTATSGRMYIEFESDASTATRGPGFKGVWKTNTRPFATPQASFMVADTVCVDIPVEFRDASTGVNLMHRWDVGADSTFESTSANYVHTFDAAGTYAVKLHVENCGGIDTITKWVVAETVSKAPTPDFAVSNNKPALGDVVNVTDLTDYCVTDYEWTVTPGNHFYANQTSNTSRNPDLVFTAPGYYDIKLVVTNPQGADSIVKQQVIFVINYCKPAVVNLNNELGISMVKLTNIYGTNTLLENASAIGEAGYTNYTSTHSATLSQGSRYLITLERTMVNNPMNRAVWIDLNRDGDFDDAGELVAFESSAMTLAWTDTISIPLTAEGGATRMRVGTNRGTNNNLACGPNMFGEYEDYEIILVPDQEAPVITLIGADTLYLQQCDVYSELGATAYDNVDGDISSQIVITNNLDSSVTGAQEVWYDVTDASGNPATRVVRTVIVDDDTVGAVLTLAGNNPDTIDVHTMYTEPGYTAIDMCDGDITSQVTIAGSVDTSLVGTYMLSYSVTDASNNTTIETRTVVVADRTLPQIALNGTDTVVIDVHTSYTEDWVTFSDNYDTNLTVIVTGAVDTAMVGTYVLEYCVTDAAGNGPVCVTRVVIVEDTEAPVVTLIDGSSITWEVNVPFTDPGYTVVDNSQGHVDVTVTGTVDVTTLDTFTLTYTFTDGSNNITQLTRTVEVVDIRAPIISLNGPMVDTVNRWASYNEPGFDLSDNYYSNAELTVTYGGSFEQHGTLLEGTYTRTYQAEDPSGNKSAILQRVIVVVLDTLTGINEPGKPEVKVYPNPAAKGVFTVSVNVPEGNSRTRISITNMVGAEVMILDEGSINADRVYPVDMGNAAAGVYFVRVASESHVTIKKVVITR